MPDFDLLNASEYKPPKSPSLLPNPALGNVPSANVPSFNPEKLGSGEQDDVSNLLNFFSQPPANAKDYTAITSNDLKEQSKRFNEFDPNIPNYEAYKAYGQSGWDRVANAGANLVTKFVGFLGQTVGFIGGAIPAAVGGTINLLSKDGKAVNDGNAISYMTDNFLVKASEDLHKWISDAAPIYKGYSYQNGNIWDKLSSSSWWLDDAIDRAALTLSMLVPGMAEAKGISLFGAAARAAEGIDATGVISKILANSAKNPLVSKTLGKLFSNGLVKGAIESSGAAGEIAANTGVASLLKGMQYGEIMSWNIIGQNALNARESQIAIREKLEEQNQKGLTNYTKEEIDNMSADGARKAFLYTLPVNLLSSLFELPQVFSSLKGQTTILKGLGEAESIGEFSEKLAGVAAKSSKPSLLKLTGKSLITAIEHGQTESAQVAIGRAIEDAIAGKIVDGKVEKNSGNIIIESAKELINNFSDPNGQNNIALGTIQGLLTTIFGHAYKSYTGEYKKQDESRNSYINGLKQAIVERRMINGDMDLVIKDENGKAKVDENGNFVYDQSKIAQLGASYIDGLKKVVQFKEALDKNDYATIEKMNHNSLRSIAYNFFQDKEGVDSLKNLLRLTSLEEQKNPDRKNLIINNIEQTPEVQLQNSYEKVDKLYEIYKTLKNSNLSTIPLEYNSKDDQEVAFLKTFLENSKLYSYNVAADQLFYADKLNKNNIELSGHEALLPNVIPNQRDEKGFFKNPSSPSEVRINQILSENETLNEKLNQAKEEYRSTLDANNIVETWNKTRDDYRKLKKKIEEVKKNKSKEPDNEENPSSGAPNPASKTEDTESKFVPGKTYLVGKSIDFDNKNQDAIKVKPTSITIDKENKDGSYEITDDKGIQRTVSKKELDDYFLFEKDENNETHNYYESHANDLFSYTLGEGDNAVTHEGILQYHPEAEQLFFVFKNKSNKLSRIPVSPESIIEGKLEISKKISPDSEKQKEIDSKYVSEESVKKSKQVTEKRINERREALLDRIAELKKETDEKKNTLNKKQDELSRVNKEYDSVIKSIKEFGNVDAKEAIKKLTNSLDVLKKIKKELTKEVEQLKNQIDDNEFIIKYIEDYIKNTQNIPTNLAEEMYQLNNDLKNLKNVGKETKKQYESAKQVIKTLNDNIKRLANLVSRLINKFNDKYNENVIKEYNETLFNDLSEPTGSLLEYINDALKLEENKEKLSISQNELAELKEKAKELENDLKEYRNSYKALSDLLNTLGDILPSFQKSKSLKKEVAENLSQLFKQNGSDEKGVDDTAISDKVKEDIDLRGNKKSIERVASTSDASGENGYAQPSDNQKRHQGFLNIVDFLPNRKNIRIVIITSKNEKALGLSGIIDKSLEGIPEEKRKPEDVALALYIERDGNRNYIINSSGKRIAELGRSVDLDEAVYSLMSSLSLTDSRNKTKYNENDENKLNRFLNWYKNLRDKWFSSSEKSLNVYEFKVSRGIPNVYKTNEKIPVTKNLISEKNLSIPGLIKVSTGVPIALEGGTINLLPGRLLFVYKNNYYFLNNRNLSKNEANNIIEAFKSVAISLEKGQQVDSNTITYLQSVLNLLKTPPSETSTSTNSLWIDGSNLVFGKNKTTIPLNVKYLTENKDSIIKTLLEGYHSVNKKLLDKNENYYELIKVDENGKPTFRVWKSYQHYLLSDKYNLDVNSDFENLNGKQRADVPPLTTNLVKLDVNQNSYPFKQRYSYLIAEEPEANNKNIKTPEAKKETQNKQETTDNKSSLSEDFKEGEFYTFNQVSKKINSKIEEQIKNGENVDVDNLFESEKEANTYFDETFLLSGETNSYPQSLYEEFQKTGKVAKEYISYISKIVNSRERALSSDEVKFLKEIRDKKSTSEKNNTPEEEKKVEEEVTKIESKPSPENLDIPDWAKDSDDVDEKIAHKIISSLDVPRITEEEIKSFKEWMQKNLPNIPIHIVDKIISVLNSDRKAWGKVNKSGITLFKAAKKGTEYHEAFEAVFNFYLTPEQQVELYNEFKKRKGNFKNDNEETINYGDASFYDFKEKIADEFYDFIKNKQGENKSFVGKISKFFKEIYEFIKHIFNLSTNYKLNKLYESINKGAFSKNDFAGNSEVSSEFYSKIGALSVLESKELLEDIIANIGFNIIGNENSNSSFYDIFERPDKFNSSEIYDNVKSTILANLGKVLKSLKTAIENSTDASVKEQLTNEFQKALKIGNLVNNNQFWKEAVTSTNEAMRIILKIKMDDEKLSIEEQNNQSKNDYTKNDFYVDSKKNASTAIKILLSTLVKADSSGKTIGDTLIPDIDRNSYGGFKLLDFSKSFIDILKTLSNTNTLDEMMKKLYDLSISNPDYVRLFKRLKGDLQKQDGTIDYDNLSFNDIRLLMDFHSTFSKQAPLPYILNMNENGEVFVSFANFDTLTSNIVDGWVNNLRYLARKGNEYIKKDTSEKLTKYSVKINKNLKFSTGKPSKTILKNEILPVLEKVGVRINSKTIDKLSDYDANKLKSYAEAFLKYLEIKDVTYIKKESITSLSNLTKMAEIIAMNSDTTDKYTYRNIEGKQQQLYINHNYFSAMIDDFNNVKTFDELLEKYPMYNDVFSQNSVYFKKGGIYFDEEGNRTSVKFEISYLNGVKIGEDTIPADRQNFSQRIISTVNMLINGYKPFINASDASTEWMIKLKNVIDLKDVGSNVYDVKMKNILLGYLTDEINLIKDVNNRNYNLYRDSKENKLRFFDSILNENLKNEIYKQIENNTSEQQISEFLINKSDEILNDFNNYLKEENKILKLTLENANVITGEVDNYFINNIDSAFLRNNSIFKKLLIEEENEDSTISKLDSDGLNQFLTYLNANYFIHSTELHKMFIGDPNTLNKLSDEFKRLKSFQSPARRIESNDELNKKLDELTNNVNGVEVPKGVYGYVDYSNEKSTFTLSDFVVLGGPALKGNTLYENVDRADAQMWMMPSLYKEIVIKGGMWKDGFDEFYNYDSAKFRQWYASTNKGFNKKYNTELLDLKKQDEKIIEKGYNKDYVTQILKPIIRGQKTGIEYIDTMLDKTSAFPIFFTFSPEGSHMRDLMVKMFQSKQDYTIVLSGRKIGAQKLYNFYTPDGKINDEGITKEHSFKVPITNFSIQLETTGESHQDSRRGTQISKEVSLNLMEAGIPKDYETKLNLSTRLNKWLNLSENERLENSSLYRMYKRNEDILKRMTEHGYKQMLKKIGLKEENGVFKVENLKNLHETLYSEILRYDVNQNAIDSVKFNPETNKFNIDFEASANYQRIKNIILSIVDKAIVSQRMNGGGKIQLSSAFFDKNSTISPYIKINDRWEKVEDYDSLSEAQKKNVRLFSDNLKFYEKNSDGTITPMEVYLPHWFGDTFRKLGMTNEEIIEKINSDEKLKSILEGIGFRIPTQELNSMEVFKVKGFLPREAGDTIVVPSEITKKAGSDFDVDKLFTYLKNVIVENNGDIIEIPYEEYLKGDDSKLRKLATLKILQENYKKEIEDLEENDFIEGADESEKVYNLLVKKALENAYIDSLKEMILHKDNYDRLIKPNDNHKLEELADEISKYIQTNIVSKIEPLSLSKAIENRNLSIFGKSYVGVGALAQTNHSVVQKNPIYIDVSRVPVGTYASSYLGDGKIYLPHNQLNIKNKLYSTISGIFDTDGYYISDKISAYINGFVDIAKNSFLYKLGVNLRNAGIFIMLERLGVPSDYVAYFMNQPIIRRYMQSLDANNIKGLFSKEIIDSVYEEFNTIDRKDESGLKRTTYFSKEELLKEIKNYSENGKFNSNLQLQVFGEFLKYAKMSQHLRAMVQGTTWDTSNFVDFSLVDFKNLQYLNSDKNIFGNLESIIGNTFIGEIRKTLNKGMDSLSSIFKLRENKTLNIINSVLYDLINPLNTFVSEDEIIQMGNRVVSSFLDFCISSFTHSSSNLPINTYISRMFDSNGEKSIPNQIREIQENENHPLYNNYFIQNVKVLDEINGMNILNLKYIGGNDVLSENRTIDGLSEIKNFDENFYKNLIYYSVLQSGIYKSPLSYTQLIPLDDYAEISEKVINKLNNIPEINKFAEENLFLRNFWKTYINPKKDLKVSKNGNFYNPFLIRKTSYPLLYQELEKLGVPEFVRGEKGEYRNFNLPILVSEFDANSDIITIKTNNTKDFSSAEIQNLKNARNYNAYKVIVGYKRVLDSKGNPIKVTENENYIKYLYKPINLYGDGTGTFLNEYRIDGKPSQINNGTMKVNELPDSEFEKAFKFYIDREEKNKNLKIKDSNKC